MMRRIQRVPTAVYWLAFGAFAIGTEGFIVSPLLPKLATDLSVRVQTAGLLAALAALSYAVASTLAPILAQFHRRRGVLLASISIFIVGNILASASREYWQLMLSQTLLAAGAGIYVPCAKMLAGTMVKRKDRDRVLLSINVGVILAVAVGVPAGAAAAHWLGWRTPFVIIAGVASIAICGLVQTLPKVAGQPAPLVSVRAGIDAICCPRVPLTLFVTLLWAAGAFTVYAYLSVLLAEVAGIRGWQMVLMLCMCGGAAAVGAVIGGWVARRLTPHVVLVPTILLGAVAFAMLSVVSYLNPFPHVFAFSLGAIILWATSSSVFYRSQQVHLVKIAPFNSSSILLSLNTAVMYLGFSAGTALGAFTISSGSLRNLGWAGAACEILAGALALASFPTAAVERMAAASNQSGHS